MAENAKLYNDVDIRMTVKEDGIYLTVNNRSKGKKINRKDILDVIESNGVKDIDFMAVNEIFASKESVIIKKISSNKSIVQKKEIINLDVSKDKMQASISFAPPLNDGPMLTVQDVIDFLSKSKIQYGIIDGAVEEIMQDKTYGFSYTVATGTPAVDGIDGYLQYHFEKNKKRSLKPKVLDSGKVDYHALDLIEKAYQGQVLVTSIPPREGRDGMDVFGRIIPHRPGKQPPPLPKGKNVSYTEDETQLTADVGGQIIYTNSKINISPVLEIKGNVDHNTGDIDFNGTVVVKGNVLTGFTVNAIEDVEIVGVVEGANIQSGGNLLLCSGVQGQEKAMITAGKDISAKFIENATVFAGGNIVSDSIMHSNVRCEGSIELMGRKSLLVGGKVCAGISVSARMIGSNWATTTEIEVGMNQEKFDEYTSSLEELKKLREEFKQIEGIIELLNAANKKQELPEEKKNLLLKSIHTKMILRQNIYTLQNRISDLMPYIENKVGYVAVSDTIRPGVKVLIGNAMMFIRDEIQNCKLVNADGKIIVQPFS